MSDPCIRKQAHETRAKARAHLVHLMKDGRDRSGLNAYRCPQCGKWHVGRQKPHTMKVLRAEMTTPKRLRGESVQKLDISFFSEE